ncbi:clusterin isoform X2 [Suncus etruscus]|nr:clusterin isoform X2 [Suncus etruscus]
MKSLLLLLGLLLLGSPGQGRDSEQGLASQEVSDKELQEMSAQGSKYINKEMKNAFKGMKQMKSLIEKNNEERKALLDELEEAKMKKEDALNSTREYEEKLKETQGMCNDSMLALWEECKPCLKQTCMKFYARVCRSGSGAVGQQLEEFLNQSSPFYLWMNGDRVDSLLEDERQQAHELDIMQDRFHHTSSLLDSLFADSLFTREMPEPHFFRPFGHRHHRPSFFGSSSRVVRSLLPFHHFEPFNFDSMFRPFLEMMNQVQQAMETQLHESLEHLPETSEGGNNRTVCKEIRHNSTGCLRMKNQCSKCREILAVDCSASNPAQEQLRQDLRTSLLMAEKFSRRYDQLMRSYQQKMLSGSTMLKQLNQEFSWVSRLVNFTQGDDQELLKVTKVNSQAPTVDGVGGATLVDLKLFDSMPLTVAIPDSVPRRSPKFMEIVSEKALQEFRQQERVE